MERRRRGRDALVLGAILLAAALIRATCLRTEPWLDEIWSIELARTARSALGVFTSIHHDNNHPLNTLWLYFVGGRGDWALDRLFSYVCGLLTVAALAADREDPARGLLTAALAAVSAPLVLYSTEARGYAPMVLCAVLCRLLLSAREPLKPARAAAFALCAALGMFSQPLFVYVLAALAVWAAVKLPRARRVSGLLALFGPAVVLFGLYEASQFGRMEYGAADFNPFWSTFLRTMAQWSGAPEAGAMPLFGAAVLVGICAWELARLRRERRDEFWFYAAVFAGGVLFVAAFPFRYERYFVACLPFALMLIARLLTRLFRGGRQARLDAALAAGLFLLGNAVRVRALATAGRGHYREAVERMDAGTTGPVITVGSDHTFRNPMVLGFYASYARKPIRHFEGGWKDGPPDWYIAHSFSTEASAAPVSLTFPDGATFRLVEVYPYAGMSGWAWWLYRRDAR